MAMDVLRSCYATSIRPFADTNVSAPITWFWCAPGALTFPGETVFCSLNFSNWHAPSDGPGEVFDAPRPWRAGENLGPLAGQHFCGRFSDFQGQALSTRTPLARNALGLSACCLGYGGGLNFASPPIMPGLFGRILWQGGLSAIWGYVGPIGGGVQLLGEGDPKWGFVAPIPPGPWGGGLMRGGIDGQPGWQNPIPGQPPGGGGWQGGIGAGWGFRNPFLPPPNGGGGWQGGIGAGWGFRNPFLPPPTGGGGWSGGILPGFGYRSPFLAAPTGGLRWQGGNTPLYGYKFPVAAPPTGGVRWQGGLQASYGKLYTQTTNTDTTCDVASIANRDLGYAVGTGTSVSTGTNSASYFQTLVIDIAQVGPTGSYQGSLDVTMGPNASAQYRLQVIDASCAVLVNTSYSSPFTTSGVKTLFTSISWPAGGVRIRISLEVKKTGGPASVTCTVKNTASSFISVPAPA